MKNTNACRHKFDKEFEFYLLKCIHDYIKKEELEHGQHEHKCLMTKKKNSVVISLIEERI